MPGAGELGRPSCKCFRDGGPQEGGTSWCTWTSTGRLRFGLGWGFDDGREDMSRVL